MGHCRVGRDLYEQGVVLKGLAWGNMPKEDEARIQGITHVSTEYYLLRKAIPPSLPHTALLSLWLAHYNYEPH